MKPLVLTTLNSKEKTENTMKAVIARKENQFKSVTLILKPD
jgi:hypothetical protein